MEKLTAISTLSHSYHQALPEEFIFRGALRTPPSSDDEAASSECSRTAPPAQDMLFCYDEDDQDEDDYQQDSDYEDDDDDYHSDSSSRMSQRGSLYSNSSSSRTSSSSNLQHLQHATSVCSSVDPWPVAASPGPPSFCAPAGQPSRVSQRSHTSIRLSYFARLNLEHDAGTRAGASSVEASRSDAGSSSSAGNGGDGLRRARSTPKLMLLA